MGSSSVHTTRAARSRSRGLGVGVAAALAALASLAGPIDAQEPAPDGPPRIAVVNVDYVATQSPSGQALQRDIQALRDQYAAGLEERQQEVQRIEQRVATADSLSAEERRTLEREYQDALTNVRRYQQDVQDRAQRMQTGGLARIREEIGPVLEAIMQEEGYDLVLNAQDNAIVLSSDRIDITRLVLDRLVAAPGGS